MRKFFIILLAVLCSSPLLAQTSYGVKGGLTIGTQRWNSTDRQPLFRYNASVFAEKMTESRMSIIGEIGYHAKGSAIRSQYVVTQQGAPNFGQSIKRTDPLVFHNASLILGAKSRYELGNPNTQAYYLLGLRGDFTIKSDMGYLDVYFEDFVNRFNYGVTVGGGIEFGINETTQMFIEFQASPDFSKQIYRQPFVFVHPDTNVQSTWQEQNVTNLTFEVIFGVRFNQFYEEEEVEGDL